MGDASEMRCVVQLCDTKFQVRPVALGVSTTGLVDGSTDVRASVGESGTRKFLEVRRVTGGAGSSAGIILAMPRPPRTRPIGRPALPYKWVQLNAKVHPQVRLRLNAVAKERGTSVAALLLEYAAEVTGSTVEEVLATQDVDGTGSELPMTG